MPRKKDGMEVDFRPGLKKDADGKPLLYVAPKKGRNKTQLRASAVTATTH